MKWVKAIDRVPAKKGVYKIKGLNNRGNPAEDDIWWTGVNINGGFIIREGCKVLEWLDEDDDKNEFGTDPEIVAAIEDWGKEMGEDAIKFLSLEAYPEHIVYGANQPQYDKNKEERAAFIKGFKFRQWLINASMTGPEVPLHIKYRMYKNQEEAKDKMKWEKFNNPKN